MTCRAIEVWEIPWSQRKTTKMFLFEKVRSPKYSFSKRDILRNYTFLRVIFSGIILFEKVHRQRDVAFQNFSYSSYRRWLKYFGYVIYLLSAEKL